MRYSTFNACFKIQYQCQFGYSVYIIGNIPELGNWDIDKVKPLDWTKGDYWIRYISIKIPKEFIVEYKYIIACTEYPRSNVILWEKGQNRLLNLRSNDNFPIIIDDIWEHRKIRLMLINHLNDMEIQEKYIALSTTLCIERTSQFTKLKMDFKENKHNFNYWLKDLILPIEEDCFLYKFHIMDTYTEDEFESERDYNREFDMKYYFYPKTSSLYYQQEEEEEEIEQNRSLKYCIKDNILIKCSFKFRNAFSFNKITNSIYIGCYPQCKSDILTLKKKGIQAVLNLQTKSDMIRNDIDSKKIKEYYAKIGIIVVNIPIKDKDPKKITNYAELIADAAIILKLLKDKFDAVYVHCTYGIVRAPTVVSLYLSAFHKINVEDALDIVKYKRRIAHPKEDELKQIKKSLKELNLNCLKFLLKI